MKPHYKKLIFILLTFALVLACSQDDSDPTPPITISTATVKGTVVNETNVPISGATVSSGGITTTTSATGEFTLINVPAGERSFVKVSSADTFDAYRGFPAVAGSTSYVSVMMIAKGAPTNFSSSSGVTLSHQGGTITIGANTVADASGNVYNGTVTAFVKFQTTSQANFARVMQGGDFAGVNSSSQTGVLISYGFYSIELKDTTGNELNIKTGSTANFTMPIAAAQVATASPNVKLWSFDKATAMWKEEGTATKTGSTYSGQVSHFSEWNCDDWFINATIKGKVLCYGNPEPNVEVRIFNANFTVYARTDSNGNYSMIVPANYGFTLTIGAMGPVTIAALSPNQIFDHGSTEHCGPSIITTAVSSITTTTAISGGTISADGGSSITAKGVCWSTSTNPTITGNHTIDGAGIGSFLSSMTGLTAGTVYYVRAYATNSGGTGYGNEIIFTSSTQLPTITTTAITAVSSTTALSGGTVASAGGSTVTARGVCWSTGQNPVATGSHTTNGSGTGNFSSNITGLAASTVYYVRAYATNSSGTAYGNQLSFTSQGSTLLPNQAILVFDGVNKVSGCSSSIYNRPFCGSVNKITINSTNCQIEFISVPVPTQSSSFTTSSLNCQLYITGYMDLDPFTLDNVSNFVGVFTWTGPKSFEFTSSWTKGIESHTLSGQGLLP